MAKLTSKERDALPDSAFAGPDRSYPVQDAGHAKAAKARASEFAPASLEKKIDAKADKVLHGNSKEMKARMPHEKFHDHMSNKLLKE